MRPRGAPRPSLNRPNFKMEKRKGAVKMRDLGIRIREDAGSGESGETTVLEVWTFITQLTESAFHTMRFRFPGIIIT